MNKLEKVIAGITGLGAFTVLTAFGSREIIEYLEKERIKREVNYQPYYSGKTYTKADEFLDALERGEKNASMIVSGSYQLQDERFYRALEKFKTKEKE